MINECVQGGIADTLTKRRCQVVADGGRWLQIKPSICHRAKHLTNNALDSILRARLQICR